MNIIAERGSVGFYEFPPGDRIIRCNCGPVNLSFPRMLLAISTPKDREPYGYILIPESPIVDSDGSEIRLAPFQFCNYIGDKGELPLWYDRTTGRVFSILKDPPASPRIALQNFWDQPFLPFVPKIKVSRQLCITGKKQWTRLSKSGPSFQDRLDFDYYLNSQDFRWKLIFEGGIPKLRPEASK